MPPSLPLESIVISELPYIPFLCAYPHPAFLLPSVPGPGKLAPSLQPIWCNPTLVAILTGSHSTRSIHFHDKSSEHITIAFVESLRSVDVRRLGEWVASDESDILLTMRPQWLDVTQSDIQLEVTKTRSDKIWICTTIPRSPLPPIPSTPITIAQRRARDGMQLSFNTKQRNTLRVSSLGDSMMAAMLESFDWSSTPLGPREQWPQSLITTLGVCLSSSVPVSPSFLNDLPPFPASYRDAVVSVPLRHICSCYIL